MYVHSADEPVPRADPDQPRVPLGDEHAATMPPAMIAMKGRRDISVTQIGP
jgi:hypothetical protein